MYHVKSRLTNPVCVTVTVNGKDLVMEVDTGASVSIISEDTFRDIQQGESTLAKPPEVHCQITDIYWPGDRRHGEDYSNSQASWSGVATATDCDKRKRVYPAAPRLVGSSETRLA